MYLASFIFRPGLLDDEFRRINDAVAEAARGIEGYAGEDAWSSDAAGLRMANYYWRTRDALDAFAAQAQHSAAKREQRRWYDGYHVIISKIVTTYGDGRLEHVTGDARREGRGDAG